MLLPLKRYADFNGRSRRTEYWMFHLAITIALVAAIFFILAVASTMRAVDDGFPVAMRIFLGLVAIGWLAIIIPSLAVQVRRFHDQDLSGWFVLLGFIPYVGGIVIIVFMCLPGTKGDNRYGPDPLDPEGVERLGSVFS
ncbi:MAG: DUF805 domain-containing protein [Sphingomonas bacterium]